jgi:hypothetical protein
MLKNRQSATRHLDSAGCIHCRLGRYTIASTHQEYLEKFGGLAGVEKSSLQHIVA